MSPYALTIRLPSGREYWFTDNVPAVGDIVSHAGVRYAVVSCEEDGDERFVVTLKAESDAEDDEEVTVANPILPVSPA